MAQVAGRAGRHELRGKVILQSMEVSASVIAQVVNHDYEGMFREQIEERRQFSYPPFCRLTDIYVKHKDLAVVEHMAEEMTVALRRVFGTRVLGPVAPPVARQQSLHIRKITLKTETSASPSAVSARLTEIVNYIKSKDVFRSASVVLDVDPL